MTRPPPRRQRGITLVEALIGFLVLSLGLMGALRMQSWLRLNGDIARQRTEAVRLAQQDMEQVRAFSDARSFRDIASHREVSSHSPTVFTLTRTVSPHATLKQNQVDVSWQDRSGAAQTILLQSSLVGLSPVYSAALALPSQDRLLAARRHLPNGTKRLSLGRSVLKPSSRSSVAWIINDASGEITAQCRVPTTLASADISEADLQQCSELTGRLLRGYIRFSLGTTPDPAHANDTPLALTLTRGAGRCETEAIADTERYLAYTCFVPPNDAEPLRITPVGWAFGETAATYRSCRYLGASATSPQNYLVIRGDAACPGAPTPHNGVSVATVQHQP
jgi:Tfp pilus assembly protein PilV